MSVIIPNVLFLKVFLLQMTFKRKKCIVPDEIMLKSEISFCYLIKKGVYLWKIEA